MRSLSSAGLSDGRRGPGVRDRGDATGRHLPARWPDGRRQGRWPRGEIAVTDVRTPASPLPSPNITSAGWPRHGRALESPTSPPLPLKSMRCTAGVCLARGSRWSPPYCSRSDVVAAAAPLVWPEPGNWSGADHPPITIFFLLSFYLEEGDENPLVSIIVPVSSIPCSSSIPP